MDKKESLTFQDVKSVVTNAVNWWVSAISNKGGEVTQEQMQDFQTILSSEVQVGLARTGYVTLSTDYYPEGLLANVAHQTSIKGSAFPQKVFMDVSPREAGVRQNHSPRNVLFSIQKKTKLASDIDGPQKLVDPLSNT